MDKTYTNSMKEHVLLVIADLEGLALILDEREFTRFEYRAAERTLQILIESCIGIAKHWCKSLIGTSPADAYSAFKILQDHQCDTVLETEWRQIIGMRNALVHDYLNIDQSVIEFIIKNRKFKQLEDFAMNGLEQLEL